MCYDAKSSFLSGTLGLFICLLLWIRNQDCDRYLSVGLITIVLVQWLEGFYYLGYDPSILGKLLYLLFFFQLLILAFLVYLIYKNTFTSAWVIFALIVFLLALYHSTQTIFSLRRNPKGKGHLEYIQKDGFLTLPFGIQGSYIYLALIFLPLLYLAFTTRQLKYWILFFYLLISLFVAYVLFPIETFGSMWCYLSIGLIFLVWFLGIFGC